MLAQEESRLLDSEHIGTEHLLLGLIAEGEGVAAKVLQASGFTQGSLRAAVLEATGPGSGAPGGHIPFTPRAKKALELSLRASLEFGHNYIGTEHILLGIVREGDGVAMRVLAQAGADATKVREKVIELMSGQPQHLAAEPPPAPFQPVCPACQSPLEGRLGAKALAATSDDGEGVVPLTILYCRACGRSIGWLPGASSMI